MKKKINNQLVHIEMETYLEANKTFLQNGWVEKEGWF